MFENEEWSVSHVELVLKESYLVFVIANEEWQVKLYLECVQVPRSPRPRLICSSHAFNELMNCCSEVTSRWLN